MRVLSYVADNTHDMFTAVLLHGPGTTEFGGAQCSI